MMFDIKSCPQCGFSEHLGFQEVRRVDAFETEYWVRCAYCGWQKMFKSLPMDYISRHYGRAFRTW